MNNPTFEIPDNIDAKEADYLYLKSSGILGAGNGLFTSIKIYKNEVISLFKGDILSQKFRRLFYLYAQWFYYGF